MIFPLFDLFTPSIVENKLACVLDLLKVLKDEAPASSNFFSQYFINSRFEVLKLIFLMIFSLKFY